MTAAPFNGVCQPTVAGTNSTWIPSLGYSEEENFIQCKQLNWEQHHCGTAPSHYSSIVKQLGCGTAQLWRGPGARRPWDLPALLCSSLHQLLRSILLWPAMCHASLLCSAVLWSWEMSSVFQPQAGNSLQSLVERASALSKIEESWLTETKVLAPGPWLVCP